MTGRFVALLFVATLVVVDVRLFIFVSRTLSAPLGLDNSYTGLLKFKIVDEQSVKLVNFRSRT